MFCCGSQPLHINRVQIDFDHNLISPHPEKVQHQIHKSVNQTILPRKALISKDGKFYHFEQNLLQNSEAEYLLHISEESKELTIEQAVQSPSHDLWVNLLSDETELTEGCIFAFEFPKFQVYHLPKSKQKRSRQETETNYSCRICFGKETSQKNPLMVPCSCSGSIKYVHLQCQQQWMREGANVTEGENFQYYNISKIRCNVCKNKLHNKMTHNKKHYYLFDMDREHFAQRLQRDSDQQSNEAQNFVILTLVMTTEPEKEEDQTYGVIQIKMPIDNSGNGSEFCFGNDEEADLIIELIGSPLQAGLYFKNHKLYLKDKNSNSGTSIRVKDLNKKCTFNSKDGFVLRHDYELYHIRNKKTLFQCFGSPSDYNLVFKEFSKDFHTRNSEPVSSNQQSRQPKLIADFGPRRRDSVVGFGAQQILDEFSFYEQISSDSSRVFVVPDERR